MRFLFYWVANQCLGNGVALQQLPYMKKKQIEYLDELPHLE